MIIEYSHYEHVFGNDWFLNKKCYSGKRDTFFPRLEIRDSSVHMREEPHPVLVPFHFVQSGVNGVEEFIFVQGAVWSLLENKKKDSTRTNENSPTEADG